MLMYDLLEWSLNYFETTGCLQFYSKEELNSFNVYIGYNNNNFKSFDYNINLRKQTVADELNEIIKNAAYAMPLKYLRNF